MDKVWAIAQAVWSWLRKPVTIARLWLIVAFLAGAVFVAWADKNRRTNLENATARYEALRAAVSHADSLRRVATDSLRSYELANGELVSRLDSTRAALNRLQWLLDNQQPIPIDHDISDSELARRLNRLLAPYRARQLPD